MRKNVIRKMGAFFAFSFLLAVSWASQGWAFDRQLACIRDGIRSNVESGLSPRRSALELGGFAKSISMKEIAAINRKYGGMTAINGDISSIYGAAALQNGFFEKSAATIRVIAGQHLFDNGNKRTAFEVYETLLTRNGVRTGVQSQVVMKVIDRVATGELRDIKDIAKALRGF